MFRFAGAFDKLSLEEQLELGLGIKLGYEKIEKQRAEIGNDENGWRIGAAFGDRAFYHGDWLLRAAAALAGIYGNDAVEAMYPAAMKDIEGQKLDGSKYSYALTFPVGQHEVRCLDVCTSYDEKDNVFPGLQKIAMPRVSGSLHSSLGQSKAHFLAEGFDI